MSATDRVTGDLPARVDRPGGRHLGLDWLRIGAFALLILYHIGMVFAPWRWVIKIDPPVPALIAPMAALTPWRLALLFTVSGYASACLFAKRADPVSFAASRSRRLLVPLAFGMAVLIPLELWVRLADHGWPGSYPRFWLVDYWGGGSFGGIGWPAWEHLWFVAYLWLYTMLLAAALALAPDGSRRVLEGVSDWLSEGWRLLWVPVAVLVLAKLALLFVVPEKQGLFTDLSGHAEFAPLFLFGFTLGRMPQLWRPIARAWRPALALALIAGMAVIALEHLYPGETIPPHGMMALDRAARLAMAWAMILVLFQLADRHWNRDHRWRARLSEAVFPAYLVHQPVIVVAVWWTRPWKLATGWEALLLLSVTAGACWLAWWLGRRVAWLAPLIGMRSHAETVRTAPAARSRVGG